MDLDQLKNIVRDGQFGAITLDTSVFDSQGLRLESGLLKQLKQFKDSSTKLIISEIVKEEILSHLNKKAQESQTSIEKSLRQIKEHWIVEEQKIKNIKEIIYQKHRPQEIARERFNNFLKSTSLEIVKAEDNISVSELIQKYFYAKPPFAESGKKKNEFPDAIALMSLEKWAINHKTKILVISSDNDWNNFCKNSKHLVAINDFGQALGLFQLQNADDICEYLSERYERDRLENLQDHILNSLNHHITNIDFSLSPGSDFLYEEELEGVTIKKFEFNLLPSLNTIFRPISLNDDFLVVESNLSVNVSIDYSFSFYVRDYIDKDYVPMGSQGITVETNLDINILISFIGDLNNVGGKIEVHNIEFESATFEDEDIDLDYINPDFEPDLDDYL